MRKVIGAQGEVMIYQIDQIPNLKDLKAVERNKSNNSIISHSEQGNHHVLTGGVEVLERTKDVPEGMRILYALLDGPQEIKQDAAVPHESIKLPPGAYEFRTAREYDPFTEQARRVAD